MEVSIFGQPQINSPGHRGLAIACVTWQRSCDIVLQWSCRKLPRNCPVRRVKGKAPTYGRNGGGWMDGRFSQQDERDVQKFGVGDFSITFSVSSCCELGKRARDLEQSGEFSDGLGYHLKFRTITGSDLKLPTTVSIAQLGVLVLAEEGQCGYLLVD